MKIKRTRKISLNEAVDNELKSDRIESAKSTAKKMLEGINKTVSVGKPLGRLDERAEMNARKIDRIELYDVLASIKEQVNDEINDNLKYFRIITGVEDGKAFIDIESKDDVDYFDGFYVDDILSINDPEAYGIKWKEFNDVRTDIEDEKRELERLIIPRLAKNWGFRVIKPRESYERIDESAEDNYASVDDMVAANLFNEYQHCVLKGRPKTKTYNIYGKVSQSTAYDGENQASYDFDDDNQLIYIYLIDEEDASLAQFVADKLGFKWEWAKYRRPAEGYTKVIKISIPEGVVDMPIGDYLIKKKIPLDDFRDTERVAKLLRGAQRRVSKE